MQLNHTCPQCNARPGEKCRNYRGTCCAPHRVRGRTQLDEDVRRAEQKAERLNAKLQTEIPLFADQTEQATPAGEYWKTRRVHAMRERGGVGAADLIVSQRRLDVWIVREMMRAHLPPEIFALARAIDEKYGDTHIFWRDICTGSRRIVLEYEHKDCGHLPVFQPGPGLHALRNPPVCCETGCSKCEAAIIMYAHRIESREKVVWPPADWQAPMTREQFDALTATPPALDHAGAVDPLGLS
jgi:hypothetical protein